MKTLFKTIYYVCLGIFGVIAILLVVSVFPITGNYKMKIVLSGSMEPVIKKGSLVVIKPAENYQIGDIITFNQEREIITHRISEIRVVASESRYSTKGDANNGPDQREVSKKDIIGKVLFNIPYAGYLIHFVQKPIGFAILIIIPALLIIGDEAKKIYEEIKKKRIISN